MKITRTRQTMNMDEYALRGEGVDLRHKAAGDGMAVSWAAGVLCFREGDNRPGTEVPVGDYDLVLIGPVQEEPRFKMRKHGDKDAVVCSWEAA